MKLKANTAYDFDGVIRLCREPWASLRDNARFGIIRFLAGQLAALTANPNKDIVQKLKMPIDIVTNSPTNENWVSKLWLFVYGIDADLWANPEANRLFKGTKPNDKDGGKWKNEVGKMLKKMFDVEYFMDDNKNQAKYIKSLKVIPYGY